LNLGTFLEPPCDIVDNLLLVEVDGVIDDEDLPVIVLLAEVQPVLVLQVNLLQVVQRDVVLPLTITLLYSLLADLGAALNVDDSFEVDDTVGFDEVVVELKVDGVLSLVKYVSIAHDTGENLAVGEEGALRDPDAPADHLTVLHPLVESAHEGVYLEGESPPRLVLVVHLQEIDVLFLAHILPVRERFIQNGQFWEVLPDHL
jgi:hypothetical protein